MRWLLALLSVMAVTLRGANVELVKDGKATASIVLPEAPTDAEKLAATELIDHLAKISGATLTQGTAPVQGLVPVYIGTAADQALQAQAAGKTTGTLVLRVQPGRVDVTGLDDGVAFAAYELLEQLGVRWFMPGDLGMVIPSLKTVAVAEQTTVQVPSFTGRHFQMPNLDWQVRNRCGGPTFPAAHGFPGFAGGAGKRLFAEHPEYFSEIKGQRVMRQVCVSNPEVLKLVIENCKAYLKKRPGTEIIGMGPNDGGGFCQCANCRALDAEDYDPFSAENSVTDRYVWFFNQVLKGLHDEYPNVKIGFYIYHTYMRPPVKVKPDPHITGALAPIALCRIHGPNNPVCPEKDYYAWLATEWGKLIPELWDRGYWSNLACPGFTFPIVHRLREQIPLGKRAGLYGWRVETFPHWGTELPSMWVAAKLMWNADANVDTLLADFNQKFYGPAAKPMADYLTLMNASIRDANFHTGCSWDIPHIYPPAVRQQAHKLLDQAAGMVPADSLYGQRVKMIQQTLVMLDSFDDMMDARVRVDFPAAHQALQRLDAVADKLLAYDPPMLSTRSYGSYMKRFFRPCTEQGYARVTDGNELVAACQDEWQFALDPMKVGLDLHYERPELVGPNWQTLKTSSLSWSDQGLRYYKGMSWYRQTVKVPAAAAGKRLFLWCGGVDELAKVWANGKPIGISHGAAFYPFELDATDAVKAGDNTIVMAVENERVNELGTGGIVAPVILYAPKAGADAKLENVRNLKPTFP